MKHHLNRLEKKIDTMDHRQETVNELAEASTNLPVGQW